MPRPRKTGREGEREPASSTIGERLARALDHIDRPGTFCATGSVPAILPGLEVEGMGAVGLPLTAKAAGELIGRCHRAPYGKGEETLVDTSVRRVWRLGPDRFRLANPDWDRLVAEIVEKVQGELGLEGQRIEGHLYDLLLYEKGSFFLPHRDGEKRDRMVATLVVVLPSSHAGGELVVRHDGQERIVDFGGPSGDPFRIQYAAFYADCEHEVRPLKKGYRLCLVYNLTLAKSRSKEAPSPPRISGHLDSIASLLREWAASEEASEKLAILLDHQYTQEGLLWDALKGTDRAKAHALADAARRAGCLVHLALLTLYQSGAGEESYGGYGYGRYDESDDEDDEGEDDGEYRMEEVYETRLTADHWSDPDGHRFSIGDLGVGEDEVINPGSLTKVKPEEEYEGYTGNEGMTLERWYRHAALFVWPEDRHFEVLCSGDSRRVVPELTRMIEGRKRAAGKERAALADRCRQLAAAIIARWPGPAPERWMSWRSSRAATSAEGEPKGSPAADLLAGLAALDAPELIADFLGTALIRDDDADPGAAIVEVCRTFGWSTFRPQLAAVMKATKAETMERSVRLLEAICTARPRKAEGWQDLCAALARELIAAIEALDSRRLPSGYGEWWYPREKDRSGILAGLARSLISTGQSDLMSRLMDHALATPKRYPLTESHIKAIVDLRPWLKRRVKGPFPAVSKWLESVREQLESLTAREPQEPKDFRRAAPIPCKCADCVALKEFLRDPQRSEYRLSAKEDRRKHLEQEVRHHPCDLDLRTERRGSPYTLVCTKNTASYRAALKTYHEDREHLATIEAIRASLPR